MKKSANFNFEFYEENGKYNAYIGNDSSGLSLKDKSLTETINELKTYLKNYYNKCM